MAVPALRVEALTKRFGATLALDSVDITFERGEVHALVGENGSGKSTLAAILAGSPAIAETGGYEGVIELDGAPVQFCSPSEALAAGVGLVHQELSLIEGMTVAENVTLGREAVRARHPLAPLDRAAMRAITAEVLSRFNASFGPDDRVGDLPMGARQIVEAARQFARTELKVLILDEPSAALSTQEAASLVSVARAAAAAGAAVVFVSHRLDEVIEASDRITVLREGRVVGRLLAEDADPRGLAALMVGRDEDPPIRAERGACDQACLEITDLHVDMPGDPLCGLDVMVRRGEIVGLTGLAGMGRLALVAGLTGLFPARGEVDVDGRMIVPGDAGSALSAGLVLVHEERRGVGLALGESVALNVCWPSAYTAGRFTRWPRLPGRGVLSDRAMIEASEPYLERFDVRCASARQPVGELSGGNQQKVAFSRALMQGPRALIVAEPTRGIDISAKERLLTSLVEVASEGVAVLVVSGEIAELVRVCDRIITLKDGVTADEFSPPFDIIAIEVALASHRRSA